VTVPNVQGTVVLSNACLAASGGIASGKVTAAPGTTNTLAAGTGTFASFTVNGGFAVRGATSPTVTTLAFSPGSSLLLGTGVLAPHAMTLGADVAISTCAAADGTTGVANVCDLSVAGGGTVTLKLDPSLVADPCGEYTVLTFGSLAAADAARLAQWTLRVEPAISSSLVAKLHVVNNALVVTISKKGMTIIVR